MVDTGVDWRCAGPTRRAALLVVPGVRGRAPGKRTPRALPCFFNSVLRAVDGTGLLAVTGDLLSTRALVAEILLAVSTLWFFVAGCFLVVRAIRRPIPRGPKDRAHR